MTSHCREPLAWDVLVAYWAADLTPEDETLVEEHLFACPSCATSAERIAAVTEATRPAPPPLLSPEALAMLRARGVRIRENPVAPGEINVAHVGFDVDLVVHAIGGLELADAQRVAFEMSEEQGGRVMMSLDDAPFDRANGRLLIACHAHYAHMAHDVVATVRAFDARGGVREARYTIRHIFDG